MKIPSMAALLVLLPSLVLAQPFTRLDDASRLSRDAAGSLSLESAKGLSSTALEGDVRFEKDSVVVPGGDFVSSKSAAPTLTSAPLKKTPLPVPNLSASSRDKREARPGLWLAAGLLAPVAGAVLGSMVGGVPGAIIGGIIGAAIGFVCLLVAAVKWLGKVWNP